MNPIEGMVDNLIGRFRPEVTRACNHSISFACEVTSLLRGILEAVRSEEYDTTRVRIPITVNDGTEVDLVQLPANEEWTLELVSAFLPAQITINESGSFRYIHQFDTGGSETNVGLVFFGGNTITVASDSPTSSDVDLYFQFTKRIPREAITTPFTGLDSPLMVKDNENETYRHVNTV